MSVLSALRRLRKQAEKAPETSYKQGYLDALDEAIEIAEEEEDEA